MNDPPGPYDSLEESRVCFQRQNVSLVLNSQLLVAVGTPRHSSYKHIRVELLMLCTGAILMVHQHCTRPLEN